MQSLISSLWYRGNETTATKISQTAAKVKVHIEVCLLTIWFYWGNDLIFLDLSLFITCSNRIFYREKWNYLFNIIPGKWEVISLLAMTFMQSPHIVTSKSPCKQSP